MAYFTFTSYHMRFLGKLLPKNLTKVLGFDITMRNRTAVSEQVGVKQELPLLVNATAIPWSTTELNKI